MSVRESVIERHLAVSIKKKGGMCYKFVSPGKAGVPDRICVMPGGLIVFVECKSSKGKLSSLQEWHIERLKSLDAPVYVVSSEEDVDTLIGLL